MADNMADDVTCRSSWPNHDHWKGVRKSKDGKRHVTPGSIPKEKHLKTHKLLDAG